MEITEPDKIYVLQNDINLSGGFITSNIGDFELNLNGYAIEVDGTGILIQNDSGEPIEDVQSLSLGCSSQFG